MKRSFLNFINLNYLEAGDLLQMSFHQIKKNHIVDFFKLSLAHKRGEDFIVRIYISIYNCTF